MAISDLKFVLIIVSFVIALVALYIRTDIIWFPIIAFLKLIHVILIIVYLWNSNSFYLCDYRYGLEGYSECESCSKTWIYCAHSVCLDYDYKNHLKQLFMFSDSRNGKYNANYFISFK